VASSFWIVIARRQKFSLQRGAFDAGQVFSLEALDVQGAALFASQKGAGFAQPYPRKLLLCYFYRLRSFTRAM
jgi:hypothetical protein